MGESATGKATFIRYIASNSDSELAQQLGYNNCKIIPIEESLYFGDSERIKIKDIVLNLLDNETDAVILIKWQAVDSIISQGDDVLRKLASKTPDTPKEIILLSVESDILYARVQKKSWWNNPDIPHSYYPQERQDEYTMQIKNHTGELSKLGFKVYEIDSTDGYKRII